jgi:PhoH-like ATPase
LELDKLKKDSRLSHVVSKVIQNLTRHTQEYEVLKSNGVAKAFSNRVDHHILEEIQTSKINQPILVTNDRIFQLQAGLKGIQSENYKESEPYRSEAEYFTGFVSHQGDSLPNTFRWNDQGKPVFFGPDGERVIDYQHHIWNVTPRGVYQNLALELLIHPGIDVVSIQSNAGYGKSFLALAAAFYLTHERKHYQKIYVVKPMVEIGQKLGYLPGRVDEKMEPYTRYISDLVLKLHRLRPVNRMFSNRDESTPQFNPKRFELLPLTYIRGMNIENAIVIVDEMQNMSRMECRAILSRMGEGVKCICLGDIHQVDNPYLNSVNNGLNWVVNKFKGSKIYAHIVLKGDKSRGPITDLVIKSGL